MQSLLISEEEIKGTESDELNLQNEFYSFARYPQKLKPLRPTRKEPEEIYDMIKILSHDIRSPLVTIGAALKLLKKGFYGASDEGVSFELDRLLGIVNQAKGVMEEFMGMAFSLSGIQDMHREILDIKKDIAEPVILEMKKRMEEREIILFNDALKSVTQGETLTIGNRFLLKAVFRNLIHNAIIYGGRGCKISYSIEKQTYFHKITVFNTGKPMSKKDQNILFKKVSFIKRDGKEATGGMGLGLYLVREIVHKQGGRIWYRACKKGSKFMFTIPRIKEGKIH